MKGRWLWILPAACLVAGGCGRNKPKKPDPTKGAVTGIVICDDTGKPARFAQVTLTAAPAKGQKLDDDSPLPALENTETDLDGRFRLEAVKPGEYYAFATLEGYLDPLRGLDFAHLNDLSSDSERSQDAISQWKDHLTEVSVAAHRVSDISLVIERAAEIDGSVSYDDSSPAIGMHFQLFRKTAKNGWTPVGLPLLDSWSLHATSDSHGRYSVTNLAAGEYRVCALLPSDSEDTASPVCLGNTFRRKKSQTIKVQAGDIATGADITIPLTGLHNVSGNVTALSDGRPVGHATLRLLYADDREQARQIQLGDDDGGSYSFEYVPEGSYILAVSGAQDADRSGTQSDPGSAKPPRHFADKEIPVQVAGDLDGLDISLAEPPRVKTN
jgi:hypothetical protein